MGRHPAPATKQPSPESSPKMVSSSPKSLKSRRKGQVNDEVPSHTPRSSTREITLEELALHNGSDAEGTMWTAVRNKVYNLTSFFPNHPGGQVMRLAAGREATCLIESYHPTIARVEAILGSETVPQIGVLAPKDALPESAFDDKFFTTVRSRVQTYLKKNQIPFHFFGHISYLELGVTVLAYFLFTILMVRYNSVVAAAIAGVLTGRLGFLMHSGNHRATSKHQWLNYLTGMCMDLAGSNALIWEHEHQVAHHMDPNEVHKDNDASIGYVALRFHPDLEWKWWHRFNHILTIGGMTFGFHKWVITDFVVFWEGQVGSVSFHVTKADWARMFVFKSLWLLRLVVIPWYFLGFGRMFLLLNVLLGVGAHYLENIFIVNHIQADCAAPPTTAHWATKQICATANWGSASVFWNWFSGGLNHQIEHHLFPSMSIYTYPYVSPIVKATCEEFGVPYQNHGSFASAWWQMVTYLKNMGDPSFKPAVMVAAQAAHTPAAHAKATKTH